MELEERIARIERMLGLGDVSPKGDAHASANLDLAQWLRVHRKPGGVIVVAGVARDTGIGTSVWVTDNPAQPPHVDAKAVASTAQALASEARLHIMEKLLFRERTTAELIEATGLDKGPLYHHLKELFLANLVQQRERGRYSLTSHGEMVFLVLANLLTGYVGLPESEAMWSDSDEETPAQEDQKQ
jgi:DNA-binding transcriptional ArsR family regulator